MEAKSFEPRCIETIQYPEGEVYAVKLWPSAGRLFITGIFSLIFLGASLFLAYMGLRPFLGKNSSMNAGMIFSLWFFSASFLFVGALILYIFAASIWRKETWFTGGFIHLRRSLFGISRKRSIQLNKIRSFDTAPAGNSRKKDYWAVNVNHYAGGRKIMLTKDGCWRLNLATALDSRAEAEYFVKLLTEKAGMTDVPVQAPPEIKEIAESNLRFGEKLLKSSYIIFGLWGLAGLAVCIILQYISIKSYRDFSAENFSFPMFLMVVIPFGFTNSRMMSIGLNINRFMFKEERLFARKRCYEVLRYFPFSAAIFIFILLIDFVYAVSNIFKTGEPIFLFFPAIFYVFIAFMNLRVFLSGRELIEKWRREDEGGAS